MTPTKSSVIPFPSLRKEAGLQGSWGPPSLTSGLKFIKPRGRLLAGWGPTALPYFVMPHRVAIDPLKKKKNKGHQLFLATKTGFL